MLKGWLPWSSSQNIINRLRNIIKARSSQSCNINNFIKKKQNKLNNKPVPQKDILFRKYYSKFILNHYTKNKLEPLISPHLYPCDELITNIIITTVSCRNTVSSGFKEWEKGREEDKSSRLPTFLQINRTWISSTLQKNSIYNYIFHIKI